MIIQIYLIYQMIMEYYAAQKLKESWGNKPCDHPNFEKVYYAGAYLITYACTQCGSEFTIAQKLETDEVRKNSKRISV
jgi:hypothetical protein